MLLRYREREEKKRATAVNDDDDDDDDYGNRSDRDCVREVVGKRVREVRFNTRTSQQLVLHQMVLHTATIVLRTFSHGCIRISVGTRFERLSYARIAHTHADTHAGTRVPRLGSSILSQSGRDAFDVEYCRYYSSLSDGPLTRPARSYREGKGD